MPDDIVELMPGVFLQVKSVDQVSGKHNGIIVLVNSYDTEEELLNTILDKMGDDPNTNTIWAEILEYLIDIEGKK